MNIMDRLILCKLLNNNEFIWLNWDQYLAVHNRNLKLAKYYGLITDIYMSLIDPDWPVE